MSSPPPNLGGKGINPPKPVSMHSSPQVDGQDDVVGVGGNVSAATLLLLMYVDDHECVLADNAAD